MPQPEPPKPSIAAETNQTTSRAWYSATIADFLRESADTVVGRLATHCDFTVLPSQRDAWLVQIDLLQEHLHGLVGFILMEFSIPRMGRRIDAVLLIAAGWRREWNPVGVHIWAMVETQRGAAARLRR